MSTLKATAAAALTAVVLVGTGAAIPAGPAPTTYYRGWAISGVHPAFQLWNPGPGKVCLASLTVTSSMTHGAEFLLMDKPLAGDIVRFGASWPEGISLDGIPSDERLPRSQAQLKADVGTVYYGAQILSFSLRARRPYTFHVNGCLGPGKGITIRYTHEPGTPIWAKIGARWSE